MRRLRPPSGGDRLRPARRRQPVAGAAARQRGELGADHAYAASMGCNNQKFLIFGSDPPPQCGQIKGQIARMQANLADLESARAAEAVNATP